MAAVAMYNTAFMTAETWQQVRDAFGAAIALQGPEREACLAAFPSTIRDEVASLLAAHEQAGEFLESEAVHIAPNTRIGPFVVSHQIGEGGMGSVYLARREQGGFDQRVALKLVSSPLVSADTERRFAMERHTLARLNHPNIVRILDGGDWQGRRYFVMEFVDGLPITEFARTLSLSAKLALFRTVCAAIHFAHQNLIVHRDIKPGNVLVTAAGDVKVLDFGIAKLLDQKPGTATTRLHPMSLDCASPEQIKGLPVTTATDVYSLGVLLYELLTGVSPQGGPDTTLDQAVRRICETVPDRPSAHKEGLSADLDSIVLRAIQKDPLQRYASAQEFSDDVERFLAGQPVIAQEASFRYVARKFVSRHKLALAASAASIALIMAGAGAAFWQARVASHERVLAQRRFEETRKLARTVIFDMQSQLAQLPGALPVRQKMIAQTLTYLESMARDAGGNPELLLDIAGSYARVGNIQGGVGEFNLGNADGADLSWQKSLDVLDRVLAKSPRNTEALRLATSVHDTLGASKERHGDRAGELAHYEKAVQFARRFQAAAPRDPAAMEVLAGAMFSQAIGLGNDGVESLKATLAVYESILSADPANSNKMRNVALCCKYLANMLLAHADYRQALQYAERARALDDARIAGNPGSRAALLDLTNDLGTIGRLQLELGDFAGAILTLRRNLAIRQRLSADDPGDALLSDRLGKAHQTLAMALLGSGQLQESQAEYRQALTLVEKALARAPDSPSLLEASAAIRLGLGKVAMRLNRPGDGCAFFSQAHSILLRVYPKEPRLPIVEREVQEAAVGLRSCK
jgi:eukaryotic-like serine/threonine-protein kinase